MNSNLILTKTHNKKQVQIRSIWKISFSQSTSSQSFDQSLIDMRYTKDIKTNHKKANSPSLRILHQEESNEKISFSQFDQQPTIIFLASNRDSINSGSYRPSTRGYSLQRRQSRLLTYESNLMESSPEKSESSAVDGEFVCKYLTPIKKQQFNQLLFNDQVNQNIQNQKTKPLKPLKNDKKTKVNQPNVEALNKRSITNEKHKNLMYSNMIKSFQPCGSIHETDQNTESQIREKIASTCNCKRSSSLIPSAPSIFVDPNSQIYFLKSNNNELFKKLQTEIQKNKNLEHQIEKILNQYKNLTEKNIQQQTIINNLKQTVYKYEAERKKYLAKQWEEFQLVKTMLIEKKRSKSKQSLQRNSISKQNINSKINLSKGPQKNEIQKWAEEQPKINISSQNMSLMRNNAESLARDFSNGKMSPSQNCNTVQSQNNSKIIPMKKDRKMSFQNNSQSKRHSLKMRQKGNIERILQDKLFICEQNRCKKSAPSSPSRKTCRKNGSTPKQNFEHGTRNAKK